jgi:hypothetical protein
MPTKPWYSGAQEVVHAMLCQMSADYRALGKMMSIYQAPAAKPCFMCHVEGKKVGNWKTVYTQFFR